MLRNSRSFGVWGLSLVLVASFAISCSQNDGFSGYIQTSSPMPRALEIPRNIGIETILRDLRSEETTGDLDLSYKTIWVWLFPIISTPPSDPYPETEDFDHLDISNSGGMIVKSQDEQAVPVECKSLRFDFAKKLMWADEVRMPLRAVTVLPMSDEIPTRTVWDKGKVDRTYRGRFLISKQSRKAEVLGIDQTDEEVIEEPEGKTYWSLFNVLPLDEYLFAVIPAEMPAYFENEALKAQAIAARTYALRQMVMAREVYQRPWDVDPTTWYQVYGGARKEHPKTTQAVVDTSGQVMSYENQVIEASFSANSGGITCSAEECFGRSGMPYLASVKDVEGIEDEPGGSWDRKVVRSVLVKKLKEELEIEAPRVLGIKSAVQGPSGRTWQFDLVFPDKTILLDKKQSRKVMGFFGFKSYLHKMQSVNSSGVQKVKGNGWGHGVGMCQWGANLMGSRGSTAEEILHLYYTGIQISKRY